MSAATLSAPPREAPRILNVVRLHLANPWTAVIMPWLIFGAIFALNWSIWLIVWTAASPADRADVSDGLQWNGAVFYFFVYMLIVAAQAMNATFSYALGLGAILAAAASTGGPVPTSASRYSGSP